MLESWCGARDGSPAGRVSGSTEEAFTEMGRLCASTMKKITGIAWPNEWLWVLNDTSDLSTTTFHDSVWPCGRARA